MKTRKNKNIALKVVKPKSQNHLKRNLLFLLLALLLVGAGALYVYAQKPAQGVLKSPSLMQQVATKNEEVPEIFSGKYFTFLYGKSYALKEHTTNTKAGAVILETAYLVETSAISKKIGLTMRSFPTQNLEDVPDFKMRTIATNNYQKKDFKFANVHGTSFTATQEGSFEKTFFVEHENFLVILTMTAPGAEDEKLDNESDAIIASISWL